MNLPGPPRFAWVDIESTGLDPSRCALLEIAFAITDKDLNWITGASWPIYQPPEVLDNVDAWAAKQHGDSGLLTECRTACPASMIERWVLESLAVIPMKTSPMCGSSIHFDRGFLKAYMPTLESWFHYRNLDVSSVKGCVEAWYPEESSARWIPSPVKAHRAMADIKMSIGELQWYRANAFVGSELA